MEFRPKLLSSIITLNLRKCPLISSRTRAALIKDCNSRKKINTQPANPNKSKKSFILSAKMLPRNQNQHN